MSSNELLTSPKGLDAAGARQQDPHQGLHSETPIRLVHGIPQLPARRERDPLPLNVGTRPVRTNATHASARAVSDALADAGIPVRGISASHQDGRLVVTVASAVREQVRAAVAGFALSFTTLP
jgi:hypothetical protein